MDDWGKAGARLGNECEGVVRGGPREGGVGFTDGSRRKDHAGAASAKSGIYLGEFATVMDAEALGIASA